MIVKDRKRIEFKEVDHINLKTQKEVHLFTKKDRSTFSYWFSHWCAFQLTALCLRMWKPKYLLHDIEKPWLRLFWDYKKVQKFHREHSRHHLEYGRLHGWNKMDWEALVIDWECSALTKLNAQMDADETLVFELEKDKWKPYSMTIMENVDPILNKYRL